MSSKKEEKGAADRIKAAALSAATKGMSRAQAERAATAAARNVNAYGQKEEGPSRWQERKEMKRKMYLLSTEKPVTMGQVKKDPKSKAVSTGETCQKCLQLGHWTYDCKNERVYVSRPTRSKVLKNPKLMQKMTTTHYPEFDHEEDSVLEKKRVEKEYKGGKKEKSKKRSKSKSKYRSDTESSSDSEATSESDSDSRSGSSTGSDYSSDGDRRRSKKKSKGSRKKYSSSSESSDYDSSSDSDSDSDSRKSRKKSKKHSRKR